MHNVRSTAVAIARAIGYRPNLLRPGHKHHPHRHHALRPNPAWAPELKMLEGKLRNGGYVVRQLQPGIAARITRRHLPGISTVTELQRWYPDGPVASQVLGFTGIEGNAGKGAGAGLEHQYNRLLEGRPGKQVTVKDPSGTVLDTVDVQKPRERPQRHPDPGRRGADQGAGGAGRGGAQLAGSLGDGHRHGPAHRSGDRDGHGAGL